jgi:hypothetical protein
MSLPSRTSSLRRRVACGVVVACVATIVVVARSDGSGAKPDDGAASSTAASSTRAPFAPETPDREAIRAAVERGLRRLASTQSDNGGWIGDVGVKQSDSYVVHFSARRAEAEGRAHPGVTGFAGMAFLAAGHAPGRGPYGRVVERAIDYLLAGDPSDDYLSDSDTNMYGHAFATIFLAQAEGVSRERDPRILARLRAAAHLIERCQNELGGWRYYPHAEEADLSVTVCQAQALRAAKDAGVDVKASTIKRLIAYIEDSRIERGPQRGCFYYKISGRSARTKTSFAINAAAVATLHASGVYDAERYGAALAFLETEYPAVRSWYDDHFYFWYGNWHAAQAFRMHGGPRFDAYYARVATDLLEMQKPDGSWSNSVGPGSDWSTAVACLVLAVRDGLLPLFAD